MMLMQSTSHPVSANQPSKLLQLKTLSATNTKGVFIRVKAGRVLIYSREIHKKNGFQILHIYRLPCVRCGFINKLMSPIKKYIMKQEVFAHNCACEKCGVQSVHEF